MSITTKSTTCRSNPAKSRLPEGLSASGKTPSMHASNRLSTPRQSPAETIFSRAACRHGFADGWFFGLAASEASLVIGGMGLIN